MSSNIAAQGIKTLHIAMYPWFALGHLTAFVHFSNKLAERCHRISFFLPKNTQSKFEPFNLHPDLITFIPITVPHVHGLPTGTETTADVPFPLQPLLMTAMDLTEHAIEDHLRILNPHFIFFDFTHWLPELSRKLGIKSVHFCIISPATIGYLLSPERKLESLTAADLMQPPPSFPLSSIKLRAHEARGILAVTVQQYGRNISFHERHLYALSQCDAMAFKTCREMEGPYSDYIEDQFGKPVILAGPIVPEPPKSVLEEKIAKVLDNFKAGTLVFCAFGSECILKKDQFQELVLGLELTGLPFFAVLKPPTGAETIESALPERFRGEKGMVNTCQLVLLPNVGDQIINARVVGGDLKVGVEVEKGEEDGLFTRHGVCEAVKAVMDDDSEVGRLVRANHARWREFMLGEGLENSYVDGFVDKLHELLE
ncbi:ANTHOCYANIDIN 3-O-GLUCOSIDE 2''-O-GLUCOSYLTRANSFERASE-RELATED [Salix koriyanagi]|uniref:ANTHOCYANIDIN 3-O-GLUCOSIDE 2''-O-GLUCOSYLTRANSFERASE-RELATED n=1 Tax=Salix koriyanagi TaxID=2511006 RepID=A0A9Q0UEG9_9ROSI|nr:ANTHOCYANIDIN 3-O-GLUCOSIDE 2''-O-GLUCOSYLTRANSFERASE-RELATED [Salix koriyanagi]